MKKRETLLLNNYHLILLLLTFLLYLLYFIFYPRPCIDFFRYARFRMLPLLILVVLIYICEGVSYHGRCVGENVKMIKVRVFRK